ncbi:MAG: thioredoxin [Acidobacteriota bacterium]|nr:thioredoxin [Acidobacteriota bacterium]
MIIRCPHCGTQNRLPADAAEHKIVCGKCKAPLEAPAGAGQAAGPLVVSDATFARDVEQSPLPVLVDLWAAWCGPCRMIAPIVDELASEFAGRVRVAKLNVDENPRTAARFNVFSIPTLLVFKNGQEVDRIVGVVAKAALSKRLAALA